MRVPTTLDGDADSVFEGHHVPDHGPPVPPERALWIAVIANCWADAFSRSDTMIRNTDRTCDPEAERSEARRWLVTGIDPWKSWRIEVCDLADIDEPMLRAAARRKLEQVKANEAPTAEVINIDAAFARLLNAEGSMTAAEIDTALAELARLEAAA